MARKVLMVASALGLAVAMFVALTHQPDPSGTIAPDVTVELAMAGALVSGIVLIVALMVELADRATERALRDDD